MPRITIAIILSIFFCTLNANATTLDVFPTASEIHGIPIPEVNIEYENKRYSKEILERFDFDKTLLSQLEGKIFTSLLRFRGNSCAGNFKSEIDFALQLIRGLFKEEIKSLAKNSNVIIRAHEWLMHQPSISEETYLEIKNIPVTPLTREFITDWQIKSYFESDKTKIAIDKLADQAWIMKCSP